MSARRQVWSGRPYPLGPTYDGYGTNFAAFSSVAERVELCRFDGDREERIELAHGEGHMWTAFLPGVGPGTRYGYRVDGPWDPKAGLRCNPHELLLDPYARSFAGELRWRLRNYWGYSTIGYFAPHDEYASRRSCGAAVPELEHMVRSLHQAGIEVILDVVYNHTAEGNHLGPTLSFRGLDNAAYYRLVDDQLFYYYDTTGTGNSMAMRQPRCCS